MRQWMHRCCRCFHDFGPLILSLFAIALGCASVVGADIRPAMSTETKAPTKKGKGGDVPAAPKSAVSGLMFASTGTVPDPSAHLSVSLLPTSLSLSLSRSICRTH
jgi:hypothetical protein